MTHQAYGARAGIARILRVLDRRGVRATFFVPGFSAERWPARSAARSATPATRSPTTAISTKAPTEPDAAEQERRLLRGLAALDEVLGVRPTGYRAPNWELTYETPAILARHGFTYDSG